MSSSLGAFGYQAEDRQTFYLAGFQTAEAKNSDTLEPLVLMRLRLAVPHGQETAEIVVSAATDVSAEDMAGFEVEGLTPTEQIVFPLTIEQAEEMAKKLVDMASRARERHFEEL